MGTVFFFKSPMSLAKYTVIFSHLVGYIFSDCIDKDGIRVPLGIHFIPGPDKCLLCVCGEDAIPKWCKKVLCTPPDNCKSFIMGNNCCDFICTDTTLVNEAKDDMDRKFIISVTTAFFILTLMFFIVNKLRHRGVIRGSRSHRTINDRRNVSSIRFITGGVGYLNLPNEHQFDDHPMVHFPIYKPHCSFFAAGEAPPPYDEAIADTQLNTSSLPNHLLTNGNETGISNQQSNNTGNGSCQVEVNVSELQSHQCEEHPHVMSNSYRHTTIPLTLRVTSDTNNTSDERQHDVTAINECSLNSNNTLPSLNTTPDLNHNHLLLIKPVSDANDTSKHSSAIDVTSSNFHPRAIRASLSSPLPSSISDCVVPSKTLSSTSFSSSQTLSGVLPKANKAERQSYMRKYETTRDKIAKDISQLHISSQYSHDIKKQNSRKSVKCQKGIIKDALNKPLTEVLNNIENKCNLHRESNKIKEDYHAECENCNINVISSDITDVSLQEQETMTLQRHMNDPKITDQLLKVSLTLPTNSRNKREIVSRGKVTAAIHYGVRKNVLENVSSGDEDESQQVEQIKNKEEKRQGEVE